MFNEFLSPLHMYLSICLLQISFKIAGSYNLKGLVMWIYRTEIYTTRTVGELFYHPMKDIT